VRLTLAFAVVMAAVLAGMGIFVYVRVGNALLTSVDQSLASQAREAESHVREGRSLVDVDVAGGTTLAEFVTRERTSSRASQRVVKSEDRSPCATRAAIGAISLWRPMEAQSWWRAPLSRARSRCTAC
jgi:hypothetical protein